MTYPITKFWFYPLCWILIKRVKGVEHIPNKVPFIIVSNHEKLIDPLYTIYPVLKKLNKKVHFIALPTWWFLGEKICRQWAGCIPLFNSKQAYKEAKKLIKSNKIIGIFPEAGTERTKILKTGAIRLAIETQAPILPVGLKSSYIPFNTKINIGKLVYIKNKKNVKKQAIWLLKEVYKLRKRIG